MSEKERLISWAARLVRLVCGAELARDIDSEVSEPIRKIAIEMQAAAYALSPLPAQAPQAWQPIETAPKDARAVIGFDPTREQLDSWDLGSVEFMRWIDGAWLDPATHSMRPTHWLPLPDPPEEP